MPDEPIPTQALIKSLLSHTEKVMNHVYWFRHDLNLQPRKEHVGSAINYTDIKERKDDFTRELINTISNWIYSKAQAKKIIDERLSETEDDFQNANTFFITLAFSKFRPGAPQGQFGELLLFNFIQHFFEAAPLLRKMRIMTSTGHERFGADAIHIKKNQDTTVFILGESKCYTSDYRFKAAFSNSLTSILNTFKNLDKELDLYTYDDFIEPELEAIAKQYKNGNLKNIQYELVCLISYNETNKIDGVNEDKIKDSIKSIIINRCQSLDDKVFRGIEDRVIRRINYIIFPVWELDSLLKNFREHIIGS